MKILEDKVYNSNKFKIGRVQYLCYKRLYIFKNWSKSTKIIIKWYILQTIIVIEAVFYWDFQGFYKRGNKNIRW